MNSIAEELKKTGAPRTGEDWMRTVAMAGAALLIAIGAVMGTIHVCRCVRESWKNRTRRMIAEESWRSESIDSNGLESSWCASTDGTGNDRETEGSTDRETEGFRRVLDRLRFLKGFWNHRILALPIRSTTSLPLLIEKSSTDDDASVAPFLPPHRRALSLPDYLPPHRLLSSNDSSSLDLHSPTVHLHPSPASATSRSSLDLTDWGIFNDADGFAPDPAPPFDGNPEIWPAPSGHENTDVDPENPEFCPPSPGVENPATIDYHRNVPSNLPIVLKSATDVSSRRTDGTKPITQKSGEIPEGEML